MKTIGLLGGMSWESTLSYYQSINQGVKTQLGGLHSAKIALYSVDFAQIEQLQHQGDWQQTAEILAQAAKGVQAAGADCLLICTNTMHKVAEQIQAQISIPILHIADATAEQLVADNIGKVGLLGTAFTMEQDFYKQRLVENYGIEVLVPDVQQRQRVHQIIYTQLCLGVIKDQSRDEYLQIIDDLYQRGAQAVILGCTEIALLISPSDTDVPLYDTTAIHAQKAVEFALSEDT
ncbi:MAG: aspartate racemase [Osedax symbiont Rs2]|nr:MAG: aspartate racemase [Osedax symbiont Rs2]